MGQGSNMGGTALSVLGNVVGGLGMLGSLKHGGLLNALYQRQQLLQDPEFRAGLNNSPFSAGTMFVGGQNVPNAPAYNPNAEFQQGVPRITDMPERDPASYQSHYVPNLPPTSYGQQLEETGSQQLLQAIQQNPEIASQWVRHKAGLAAAPAYNTPAEALYGVTRNPEIFQLQNPADLVPWGIQHGVVARALPGGGFTAQSVMPQGPIQIPAGARVLGVKQPFAMRGATQPQNYSGMDEINALAAATGPGLTGGGVPAVAMPTARPRMIPSGPPPTMAGMPAQIAPTQPTQPGQSSPMSVDPSAFGGRPVIQSPTDPMVVPSGMPEGVSGGKNLMARPAEDNRQMALSVIQKDLPGVPRAYQEAMAADVSLQLKGLEQAAPGIKAAVIRNQVMKSILNAYRMPVLGPNGKPFAPVTVRDVDGKSVTRVPTPMDLLLQPGVVAAAQSLVASMPLVGGSPQALWHAMATSGKLQPWERAAVSFFEAQKSNLAGLAKGKGDAANISIAEQEWQQLFLPDLFGDSIQTGGDKLAQGLAFADYQGQALVGTGDVQGSLTDALSKWGIHWTVKDWSHTPGGQPFALEP